MNWQEKAAREIEGLQDPPEATIKHIIEQYYVAPLLMCIDCHNTESPAGAMAREFNHGRCLHCGGYFKVVRA